MSINFIRFRSTYPKVLTKTFEWKQQDGKYGVAKRSSCKMQSGKFEVVSVESLEELSQHRQAATNDVAFAYGEPKNGRTEGNVSTKNKAKGDVLARTENDIGYPKGRPGIMFADYDPDPELELVDEEGLVWWLRSAMEADFKILTAHSADFRNTGQRLC